MNTPSESSFINQLLNDIFEDTFRKSPAPLPWHIPKHFLEASIAQQSKSSSTTRQSFFKPAGTTFPTLLPNQFAEPSPEQPLRDALLNSVITVADLLGIESILIASRNGGTVHRLRELTDRFHLVFLPAPEFGARHGPYARLQQHGHDPQLREARLKPLANVEVVQVMDAKDEAEYMEALERILQERLSSEEDELGGERVLFCYRSFPGANCVNAFRILNF
uniref:Uncharacterized protein n=1 Tax=Culex tarsalis TaxID=7177 RepID=A0A1Q3G041_CULTA